MKIELTMDQINFLRTVCAEAIAIEADECLKIFDDAENLVRTVRALAKEQGLSDNQRQFVEDALFQGIDVEDLDFTYSGRGMFGRTCPAVRLRRGDSFSSSADTAQDSLGLGSVVYAPY